MSLKVYYGKADRLYENTFFRSFVSQVSALFERNNIEGILLGFAETDLNSALKPDVVIFTANVALIVEIKHYPDTKKVMLPNENDFKTSPWKTDIPDLNVQGGNKSPNPYIQVQRQCTRLSDLLQPAVNLSVIGCVVFDHDVEIVGSIPGRHQKYFSIANSKNYLNIIHDSINVSSPSALHRLDRVLSLFDVQPYTDISPIDADSIKQHEQEQWKLKVKEREVATREQDLHIREQRVLKVRAQLQMQSQTEAQKKAAEEELRIAQRDVELSKQALALAEIDLQKQQEIRRTREVDLAIVQTQTSQTQNSPSKSWKKPVLISAIVLAVFAVAALFFSQKGASALDPQFRTCGEANENGYGNYQKGVDEEYAWYEDRDKDGIACEK